MLHLFNMEAKNLKRKCRIMYIKYFFSQFIFIETFVTITYLPNEHLWNSIRILLPVYQLKLNKNIHFVLISYRVSLLNFGNISKVEIETLLVFFKLQILQLISKWGEIFTNELTEINNRKKPTKLCLRCWFFIFKCHRWIMMRARMIIHA